MKLLKIGMLNLQSDRWLDALNVFDEVFVLKSYHKEQDVSGLKYHEVELETPFRSFLVKLILHFNEKPKFKIFETCIILLLRVLLCNDIQWLKNTDFDEVHVSYNDFDESALLFLIFRPYLKNKRVTRAYKESRPGYRYLEEKSFKYADRVVLNTKENLVFFQNKYGSNFFTGKDIVVDVDEDAIGEKYINGIKYQNKISSIDSKMHAVILAGRAFSDFSDTRSGSRLCYVEMIKQFIKVGIVVHLHTLNIIPDRNGINQYDVIKNEHPDLFHIEPPLNFEGDNWREAYSILSRYDYGIMHNFIEGSTTSEFDKYNIPHRYYEYLLANVAPVLLKDRTIVMQDIIQRTKCGVIYKKPEDLLLVSNVEMRAVSFLKYIEALYGKNDK